MKSLTKQELKNIVEGKRTTERIPNLCTFWMGPENFVGRVEEMREWLDNAVYDIDFMPVWRCKIASEWRRLLFVLCSTHCRFYRVWRNFRTVGRQA